MDMVACATPRLMCCRLDPLPPLLTRLSTTKPLSVVSLPHHWLRPRCHAPLLPLRIAKSPPSRLILAAATSSMDSSSLESRGAPAEEAHQSDIADNSNSSSDNLLNRRHIMTAGGALSVLSLTFANLTAPPAFAEDENAAQGALELPPSEAEAADSASFSSLEEVPDAPPPEKVKPEEPKPEEVVKPEPKPDKVDTTITDRVFLDISICPTSVRLDRTLGDSSLICSDGEPLGRIVIGLYGRQVPQTVGNFVAMCTGKAGSSYDGTIFHKAIPGQFIMAGRQGPRERGEVGPPSGLETNVETVSPAAYRISHLRPGTVSLALAVNDDDEDRKLSSNYRNVEFIITTGPGPATQLDNGNIVIGSVLEGMDVVTAIAAIPTYRPSEKIQQFNEFAQFLGDERATAARSFWDKPLKSVVISHCGIIEPPKSPLPPLLP